MLTTSSKALSSDTNSKVVAVGSLIFEFGGEKYDSVHSSSQHSLYMSCSETWSSKLMTRTENIPIFLQHSEDVCCLCDFKKKMPFFPCLSPVF